MTKQKRRVHIQSPPPSESYEPMKTLDAGMRRFDGQFDELENAVG